MILNFFICSLSIIMSSFVKSPFKSLIYFFIFVFFCLISSKSFFKNASSPCKFFVWFLNVFSQSLFCLFILLMLPSNENKFLHLMQFMLSKLSLMLVLFCIRRNLCLFWGHEGKLPIFYKNWIRCHFVCFVFLFRLLILFPQPGIEPEPSTVKARSPNRWTTREFPKNCCFSFNS